jgi:hypothetical protein
MAKENEIHNHAVKFNDIHGKDVDVVARFEIIGKHYYFRYLTHSQISGYEFTLEEVMVIFAKLPTYLMKGYF